MNTKRDYAAEAMEVLSETYSAEYMAALNKARSADVHPSPEEAMNGTSRPKASVETLGHSVGGQLYCERFVDGDRVEVYVSAWSGNVRPWRGQVYVNGAPAFVPQGFSASPSRAGESVLRRYMAQRKITCKCGSTFGYAAGKYGCPNCNGDAVGGEPK